MRKEGLEILALTGNSESKKSRGNGKLHSEFMQIYCRSETNAYDKESSVVQHYKEQDVVESHDQPQPEETWCVKEGEMLNI